MNIHHRSWKDIDENERRKWQNPEAILSEIGLKPGLTLLDIGCGTGFFTIPAARILCDTGKVYALDLESESIDTLRKKASASDLQNIISKAGRAEDTILCKGCADIAFFGIVLHDFQDPARVLANARTMLTKQGRLANLDWKKEPMEFGPPLQKRFDQAEASRLIESAGFKVENVKDCGPRHYLIMAKVSP